MSEKPEPPQDGVAEDATPFLTSTNEDWAIARERLEDYRRTGETISVEEFMDELRREVAARRAEKR
ncbi:MAG: hypothetical protein Q7U20_07670 [Caulobacter sp.]|nr:hypothetical protein [Caulobacter sp.]